MYDAEVDTGLMWLNSHEVFVPRSTVKGVRAHGARTTPASHPVAVRHFGVSSRIVVLYADDHAVVPDGHVDGHVRHLGVLQHIGHHVRGAYLRDVDQVGVPRDHQE